MTAEQLELQNKVYVYTYQFHREVLCLLCGTLKYNPSRIAAHGPTTITSTNIRVQRLCTSFSPRAVVQDSCMQTMICIYIVWWKERGGEALHFMYRMHTLLGMIYVPEECYYIYTCAYAS